MQSLATLKKALGNTLSELEGVAQSFDITKENINSYEMELNSIKTRLERGKSSMKWLLDKNVISTTEFAKHKKYVQDLSQCVVECSQHIKRLSESAARLKDNKRDLELKAKQLNATISDYGKVLKFNASGRDKVDDRK